MHFPWRAVRLRQAAQQQGGQELLEADVPYKGSPPADGVSLASSAKLPQALACLENSHHPHQEPVPLAGISTRGRHVSLVAWEQASWGTVMQMPCTVACSQMEGWLSRPGAPDCLGPQRDGVVWRFCQACALLGVLFLLPVPNCPGHLQVQRLAQNSCRTPRLASRACLPAPQVYSVEGVGALW